VLERAEWLCERCGVTTAACPVTPAADHYPPGYQAGCLQGQQRLLAAAEGWVGRHWQASSQTGAAATAGLWVAVAGTTQAAACCRGCSQKQAHHSPSTCGYLHHCCSCLQHQLCYLAGLLQHLVPAAGQLSLCPRSSRLPGCALADVVAALGAAVVVKVSMLDHIQVAAAAAAAVPANSV